MWALIFLWIILTTITFCLIVGRCTHLIYFIFCSPVLLTLLYFIFKNDTWQSSDNCDRFFKNFKLGGHRGSPIHAPENSIEGFVKAKEEGCDLVEFDIHMSSDGIPILMHDESTARTTNANLLVAESKWELLENVELKIVNKIPAKIPRLNDTIEWCLKNRMKMIFDMKNDNIKLIEKIAEEIGSRNIYDKVLVSSFNPMIAWRLKKIDPRIVTGLTMDRSYYSYSDDYRKIPFTNNILFHWWNEVLDELNMIASPLYILPKFTGVDVLMMSYRLVSENLVRESREKGFSVIAWTINDRDFMRIMSRLNVPFLTDVCYEVDKGVFESPSAQRV